LHFCVALTYSRFGSTDSIKTVLPIESTENPCLPTNSHTGLNHSDTTSILSARGILGLLDEETNEEEDAVEEEEEVYEWPPQSSYRNENSPIEQILVDMGFSRFHIDMAHRKYVVITEYYLYYLWGFSLCY